MFQQCFIYILRSVKLTSKKMKQGSTEQKEVAKEKLTIESHRRQ